MSIYTPLRTAAAACTLALVCTIPAIPMHAQNQSAPATAAPDNTSRNKNHRVTADQQRQDKTDIEITAEIRRSIVGDSSLSTYAHNVKIITQNGAVTLRGPVHSAEEKLTVATKAAAIAGDGKVTDQLTIKQ